MGLSNESGGGGNWLIVLKGEITKRVPEGTEGAVERTTRGGKKVWELKYNALEGTLTKIEVYDGDYGSQWIFTISDSSNDYKLVMPYSSGVANGFLFRLPNVNLERPVKINTYWIEGEDGKSRQFLSIHQDGIKIAPYWTKEDLKNLPPLETIEAKGQKILDDTKRLKYLRKMVDEKINPKLKELYPIDNTEQEEPEPVEQKEEDFNDLPF
jgi:hypothetical protein